MKVFGVTSKPENVEGSDGYSHKRQVSENFGFFSSELEKESREAYTCICIHGSRRVDPHKMATYRELRYRSISSVPNRGASRAERRPVLARK